MAARINLRENEYQTIMSEMEKMHREQLEQVTAVMNQMKTLVTSEDGFRANLTSQKMVDMLDTVSGEVISLLRQVFRDSEAGVANMITSMVATDTACG